MLIIRNRGYKRQYVYGGSGIFDSIANFFTRLFTSNATKQLASTVLDVGKKAATELSKKAVDVGKNTAFNVGKKMVEKGVNKFLTPKSQSILSKHTKTPHPPSVLSPKTQNIVSKYTDAYNINNLIDGSGQVENAIAIQDLVKRLNGSGIKII